MMKDDYLWDKTGTDPDIEQLENALAVFRYKETAPPELPAKVLPFKKDEPQRRIFSFAVAAAAAACLVFGIIALGIWIQFSGNNPESLANLTETVMPEIAAPTTNKPPVDKNADSAVETDENPKQFAARKISAIRKNVPVNVRRKETKTRNNKTRKTDVPLTKEEQYAYDQLMLALSITSSKFKLVKDKVEGTEEKNAVIGNGQ